MSRRALPLLSILAAASCGAGREAREAANVVWIAPTPHLSSAAAPAAPERRKKAAAPRDGPEPHHFWVLAQGEVAERREWLRVEPRTWEERFPSGAVMRYRVTGRVRDDGRVGMIARRLPDGDVEVFIPDLGCDRWPALRVTPEGDWHDLGPMHPYE